MRHKPVVLVLTCITVLFFFGCSRNKINSQTLVQDYHPDWWETQSSYLHINSYGIGESISIIASRDAAKADALLKMSDYVHQYITELMDQFESEAGIKEPQILSRTDQVAAETASSRFSNLTVSNLESIIIKTSEGEQYRTYLQLMIPKFEINRSLLEQIRNDIVLYQLLTDSSSFSRWEKLLMNR
jgi:predicted RND superfamily exporter protein